MSEPGSTSPRIVMIVAGHHDTALAEHAARAVLLEAGIRHDLIAVAAEHGLGFTVNGEEVDPALLVKNANLAADMLPDVTMHARERIEAFLPYLKEERIKDWKNRDRPKPRKLKKRRR